MRRHHPPGAASGHSQQSSFSNRTPHSRISPAPHLIDQKQTSGIQVLQKIFHRLQLRSIGTQIIVNRLLIPDVNHDLIKDAKLRILPHRGQQAALNHVLQQADGLQTHRFAPGIRTGYHQDVLILIQ